MKRNRKRPKLSTYIIPCKDLPKPDKYGNYCVEIVIPLKRRRSFVMSQLK